jgi:mono/diheme cytochrome c family protein
MIAFAAIVVVVVLLPTYEDRLAGSEIYRPRTALEQQGRRIYIANGCQYCHSQYIRPQDYDYGSERVAHAGDYVGDTPPLLGSERQGPDLSPEGGLRSDDWHVAHFINPRYTRPLSIMPPFHWLGDDAVTTLVAYVQSLGMKAADGRMLRQRKWKPLAIAAYEAGPEANTQWLHENVQEPIMGWPNPYPPTDAALKRGEKIYFEFCIGCHGSAGDGAGPAKPYLNPPPYNFSHLSSWQGPLGGMLYYQIMNGITGTAMPPFKSELESEKIWDVSHYVAVHFVGVEDEEWTQPRGIPASFEPPAPEENLTTETKRPD